MDRVWFHPPVPICFPDWVGTTIHVGNVAQATDILLRLWPVEPGQNIVSQERFALPPSKIRRRPGLRDMLFMRLRKRRGCWSVSGDILAPPAGTGQARAEEGRQAFARCRAGGVDRSWSIPIFHGNATAICREHFPRIGSPRLRSNPEVVF
jgi:hypothetical protein